jgi:hypothetical protein
MTGPAFPPRVVEHHDAPTVVGALDRMVDAVQGVVADQLKLARLEAETSLRRALVGGGMIAGAAVFALFAWATLLVAAHALLREVMHPAASLGILTAVNLAFAGGLAAMGMRAFTVAGQAAADAASDAVGARGAQ